MIIIVIIRVLMVIEKERLVIFSFSYREAGLLLDYQALTLNSSANASMFFSLISSERCPSSDFNV